MNTDSFARKYNQCGYQTVIEVKARFNVTKTANNHKINKNNKKDNKLARNDSLNNCVHFRVNRLIVE